MYERPRDHPPLVSIWLSGSGGILADADAHQALELAQVILVDVTRHHVMFLAQARRHADDRVCPQDVHGDRLYTQSAYYGMNS